MTRKTIKELVIILLLIIGFAKSQAQQPKVLFVMSAATALPLQNGKTYTNTGVFLSEFYLAYKDIQALGYHIDFATPQGKVSSIDKESYDPQYWKGREELISEGTYFVQRNEAFNHPLTLEQALANKNGYSGIVVPGGQGLMVDLMTDTLMQTLLLEFGRANKCVGLICHAPALLTALPSGNNPFAGLKVNSVSGIEELFIERIVMKGKPYNRKIGKQLRAKGYQYKRGRPAKNYAVRDRFLVTSQNPFSNQAFSKLYLEALQEQKQKP